jgi:hypothetical protein
MGLPWSFREMLKIPPNEEKPKTHTPEIQIYRKETT